MQKDETKIMDDEKLEKLYKECIEELNSIGIDTTKAGNIKISISTRATKRYGCCKQSEPDEITKMVNRIGFKRIIKYSKFNNHKIEISSWVMKLNDDIIKNTIMHEIIHCFPDCNNHGETFKSYCDILNKKLGYKIKRVGNREEDYKVSNLEYEETRKNNYKILCKQCGQIFFRQRVNKNLTKKYRCGKCGGKLEIKKSI